MGVGCSGRRRTSVLLPLLNRALVEGSCCRMQSSSVDAMVYNGRYPMALGVGTLVVDATDNF
jgi:hypothetical protein